jgi:hypothetical protein
LPHELTADKTGAARYEDGLHENVSRECGGATGVAVGGSPR